MLAADVFERMGSNPSLNLFPWPTSERDCGILDFTSNRTLCKNQANVLFFFFFKDTVLLGLCFSIRNSITSDQWCLNYAMMMHNLTQQSLVLGLKAICLHNIRWPFRNTMLIQFNGTSEFCKITMQEGGDIVQPRAKFPMPAVTQCVTGVLEIEIRELGIKF